MLAETARAFWRRLAHPQREPIAASVRRRVCQAGGNRCADCGQPGTWRTLQMGHDVPWIEGGTDDPSNLYPTCWPCNRRRGPYVPLRHRALRLTQAVAVLGALGVALGLAGVASVYGGAVTVAAVALAVSGFTGH